MIDNEIQTPAEETTQEDQPSEETATEATEAAPGAEATEGAAE